MSTMEIYEGVWFDHAAEKLILTLNSRAAGVLAAAVVTLVAFTATATWPIVRMLLWTVVTRPGKQTDVFHQQRQIMLRNSSNAAESTRSLFKLIKAWRVQRMRKLFHNLPHLLVSGLVFAFWTVAGLFTPYVYTHSTSQVLVAETGHCGNVMFLNYTASEIDTVNLINQEYVAQVDQAQSYVQQCYGASNTSLCNQYARQKLNFTTQDTTNCPLANPGLCTKHNATTLQLDTGLLDSNLDFGINTMKHERIQYRRVATCSPVNASPFLALYNTSDDASDDASDDVYPPGTVLLRYNMGPYDKTPWTLEYANFQSAFHVPYTADTRFAVPGANSNVWMVNTTLFDATDADISLMAIEANGVTNPAPVYDPVFAADIPYQATLDDGTTALIYAASYYVNWVACTEQHQICLPAEGQLCTPLVSQNEIINATWGLGPDVLNNVTVAILGTILNLLPSHYIFNPVFWKGTSVLLASRTLLDYDQTVHLPKDQWILEIQNLFSITLAKLQGSILAYATGPANPDLYPYVEQPEIRSPKLCNAQRISDPHGRVNFDMAALIGVIVVAVVLIVIGLSFEKLFALVARRIPRWRPFYERWMADHLYHVQKTGLEAAAGVGDWYDTENEVPKSNQMVPSTLPPGHDPAISLLYMPKDREGSN